MRKHELLFLSYVLLSSAHVDKLQVYHFVVSQENKDALLKNLYITLFIYACSYYVQRRMILQYKISFSLVFYACAWIHLLYLLAQQKQMLPLVTEKYQVNLFYSLRPFYYPFIIKYAWFDCSRLYLIAKSLILRSEHTQFNKDGFLLVFVFSRQFQMKKVLLEISSYFVSKY